MRKFLAAVLVSFLFAVVAAAQDPSSGAPIQLPGLKAAARITRDTDGIAHIRAQNEPGGTSGILGSPFYFNLLPGWLVNDAFPLLFAQDAIEKHTVSVTKFVPAAEPD